MTEKGIELNAAPATRRHMLDFLAAVEKRSRPVADIEEGHISTASCILANLSMQLGGRPLRYDPKSRRSSATKKPPASCGARIARRGGTRVTPIPGCAANDPCLSHAKLPLAR